MRPINSYRQLLPFVLLITTSALAQRQYWGVFPTFNIEGDTLMAGGIFRVDSTGMNPDLVVPFDTLGNLGIMSQGSKLLLASNGNIYGITSFNDGVDGKLFYIDPITDSLHIPVNFNTPQYPLFGAPESFTSLMQTSTGMIVGSTGYGVGTPPTLFKFDPVTEVISLIARAEFNACPFPGLEGRYLQGTPFEASDGYLYTVSPWNSCGGEHIVRINPSLSAISFHNLSNMSSGSYRPINGDGILEKNDTLYMTAFRGGPGDDSFGLLGRGALWGFDLNTLTEFKVLDYTDSIHNPWTGMVQAPNGTWYGQAGGPLWNGGDVFGDTLCIYTYDPEDNALIHIRNSNTPPGDVGVTGGVHISSLLAASNGKLYGAFKNGLWEYDPQLDTLRLRAPLQYTSNGITFGYGPWSALTEICRKPNYKPRPTTSFNVCAGAYFFYDLKNVNATSVVWRRNGVLVPSQTNQRLEFEAITEGDEGVWTCTLTNECGITEPPAITITVNAGAFNTPTISGDTLLCGSDDVAVLSGNTSGTWSTGATAPTLSVTQPGLYHAYRQQACGLSMSNILHVTQLDSVFAPTIEPNGDTLLFCPGDAFLLTNNDPGPWGVLPNGLWQDGSSSPTYTALDTGSYYVVAANACNSDTSNIINVVRRDPPAFPSITLRDGSGSQVDELLCIGDSVIFTGPFGAQYSVFLDNNNVGSVSDGGTYTANTAGVYQVLAYGGCAEFSDTLYVPVFVDNEVPPMATIQPDLLFLTGCDQDTAYLGSAVPYCYWTWTDQLGVLRTDTTDQLLVDWSIGFYSLYNYNGCGSGPADGIQVIGTPAPTVLYSEAIDTLCLSDALQPLSPGTPAGGTYSGPGVTGNTFNPAAAGIGEHTITYSYSDGNCTGFAQDVIAVDICQAVRGAGVSEGLWISPNPNNGVFILRIDSPFMLGMATIHDALGKRIGVLQRVVQGSNAMSFSNLTPGMYSLRIELDGLVKVQRFVVTEVK